MQTTSKNLMVTLIAILISIQIGYAHGNNQSEKNVTVTYIANEGFLIKTGDKSILIDALFGDKEYGFCDIPDTALITAMVEAKDPFANIDLIAATHKHIDHFYAPFVIEHLTNNKKGKFISCEQAIKDLAEADNEEIKTRLIEITPESLTHEDTVLNGIEIRVYRLMHGPYYTSDPATGEKINRHRNIQNIGFLFNINGVKIFHGGDSNPSGISDYEHFRLDKENIDIAFLGRGFMHSTDCEGIDILRDYINPKHIILMHIHHDQNKHFIDVAEEIKAEFPSVKVFEKRMETKNYMFE